MAEKTRTRESMEFLKSTLEDMKEETARITDLEEKVSSVPADSDAKQMWEDCLQSAKGSLATFQRIVNGMANTLGFKEEGEEPDYSQIEEALNTAMSEERIPSEEDVWVERAGNDPDAVEFVNDLFALKDSVEDSVRFADRADEELKDAEELANEVIEKAEDVLNMQPKDIEPVFEGGSGNPLTKEQADLANEIRKDVESPLHSVPPHIAKDTSEKLLNEARTLAMAKHPIRYAISSLKGAISEIREARRIYKETKNGWLKDTTNSAHSLLLKLGGPLQAIAQGTYEFLRNGLVASADFLNNIAVRFADLAKTCGRGLMKGVHSLSMLCDKVLDAVTLGAYAKIGAAVRKREESFLADYKSKENHSFLEKMRYASARVDRFFRGKEPDYWQSVTDGAFFWGTKEKDGELTTKRSPVQLAQDGISSFATKIKEAGEKTADTCNKAWLNAQAYTLGLKAEFAERYANLCEKKERRVAAKVAQFKQTDEKLFAINSQLEEALHKLNSPKPFEAKEFTPNENIAEAISLIESSSDKASMAFVANILKNDMKRDERKFNRVQSAKEYFHDVGESTKSVRAAFADYKLGVVENVSSFNESRLSKAQEKLERVQTKIKNTKTYADAKLSKANDLIEKVPVKIGKNKETEALSVSKNEGIDR